MSELQHLDGYGTSIEYNGIIVRLIAGKVEAKIWKTPSVEFPVADIVEVDYRPANMLVNGQLTFTTMQPADAYAPLGRGVTQVVPDNALGIRWRRKDQAAFAQLHDAIAGQVDTGARESRRDLAKRAHAAYWAARDEQIRIAAEIAAGVRKDAPPE